MAMIPAKCTNCGANLQVDDSKEAGICESCGTAFITEKVINNYNVTNNINVANATINVAGADIDNLLIRAKQYEESGDIDTAKEYYNRILDIDANHEIAKAKIFGASKIMKRAYIGNVEVDLQSFAKLEQIIRQGDKIAAIKFARELSGLGLAEAKNYIDNFDVIDKTEPNGSSVVKSNTANKSGCYVATCVYGSYDCPEVWTLRRYRDNTLASTWYGRAFIHTYYAISPTIVKWFGNTQWFKKLWKNKLDKMVYNLRSNGIEATPYQDKDWRK